MEPSDLIFSASYAASIGEVRLSERFVAVIQGPGGDDIHHRATNDRGDVTNGVDGDDQPVSEGVNA